MAAPPPPSLECQGQILRWRRVGGLSLGEVAFEPNQRIHRDSHAHPRFIVVLKGSLSEVRRGENVATHRPSSLIFESANNPHSYAVSERGALCLVVDMSPDWLERAESRAAILAKTQAFRGGLLLHLAHRLYDEFRLRDEVSRLAVEALSLGVVAEASRRAVAVPREAPVWLKTALAFVHLHFAEPLSLQIVARHVGVHPVHLARTFRAVYDMPFAARVRSLRIEFAQQLLAGPAPLSEIAAAAGFCDQSHFSRSFKHHTGLTPAAYRAQLR
jgi:AraC family transcriptional regulator